MHFSFLFFKISPIVRVVIKGNSMQPNFFDKQKVLVVKNWFLTPNIGNVVLCKHPNTGALLVKRLIKHEKEQYWVEGDNKNESTDSRDFGWIKRKHILGKVITPQ